MSRNVLYFINTHPLEVLLFSCSLDSLILYLPNSEALWASASASAAPPSAVVGFFGSSGSHGAESVVQLFQMIWEDSQWLQQKKSRSSCLFFPSPNLIIWLSHTHMSAHKRTKSCKHTHINSRTHTYTRTPTHTRTTNLRQSFQTHLQLPRLIITQINFFSTIKY